MNPASSPSLANSIRVLAAGMGKAILRTFAADLVQERLARVDHAAAEEDEVGVDRVHQRDGADGEVAGRLAHQAVGQGVAGRGRLGDRSAGDGSRGRAAAAGWAVAICSRASWARLTSAVAEA